MHIKDTNKLHPKNIPLKYLEILMNKVIKRK